MSDYKLSSCAFSKMLLHAAKYPHCSINGILLAKRSSEKDQKKIAFVDCIPLFHINLSLAPMVEVALTQVDTFCQSKDLIIAGYYQANEHLGDHQPNAVSVKIAERIQENFKNACIIMLDNEQMTFDCNPHCFHMFSMQESKWKANSNLEVDEDAQEIAAYLMHAKAFKTITDFDNHLDDISLEWSNFEINERIMHAA